MKCILLHGLGQSPADWKDTLKHMDGTWEALCPNLYDWLPETDPCYDHLYKGLERYCQSFCGPFVLGGLSLGGILALQYAAEHNNRVSSLILMGTQFIMPKKLLKVQNTLFRLLPGAAFKNMPLGKKRMICLCNSMMDLDLSQSLSGIHCKTLILCGKKDKANLQASIQLQQRIHGAQLITLSRAGHELNKDAPAELGLAIRSFCEKT